MTALRVIQGRRGVATEVVVRQTTLDDLINEITALEAEAIGLAQRALPLARQLRLIANLAGPSSMAVADELVRLLERLERQHEPRRAA